MYEDIHTQYVLIEEQNLYQSHLMHGRQENDKIIYKIFYYVSQKYELIPNLPAASKWTKGNH